jgi:hypothetical protein
VSLAITYGARAPAALPHMFTTPRSRPAAVGKISRWFTLKPAETPSFSSFPYVCPEHILANVRFFSIKWRKFRTASDSQPGHSDSTAQHADHLFVMAKIPTGYIVYCKRPSFRDGLPRPMVCPDRLGTNVRKTETAAGVSLSAPSSVRSPRAPCLMQQIECPSSHCLQSTMPWQLSRDCLGKIGGLFFGCKAQ